jgi:hypothetical protein
MVSVTFRVYTVLVSTGNETTAVLSTLMPRLVTDTSAKTRGVIEVTIRSAVTKYFISI